jgi:hypothetical protein
MLLVRLTLNISLQQLDLHASGQADPSLVTLVDVSATQHATAASRLWSG